MDNLGAIVRKLREEKELPLRTVAAFLDIDQAILSRIERGQRKATRGQVVNLAKYFKVNENDLLVAWLSDKLVYEVADEQNALEALQVAEKKIAYRTIRKVDRAKILKTIKKVIGQFPEIEKAWIYGSFSRADDNADSDIDIAFKADDSFSYFDLAEIQFVLENKITRKIDVGFIDSFKPYIFDHIKKDLKLIHER